jgi:hypothetical protein
MAGASVSGQARSATTGTAATGAPILGGEAAFAGPNAGSVERALADAADRALRYPQNKVVLVLHLSRLAAPAPRAHHLRVARALLQDCAQRFSGQVFVMQTQDLVLLCTAPREQPQSPVPGAGSAETIHAPAHLKQTLARLFAADVPDPARLTSLWRLDDDPAAFRAYIAGTLSTWATTKRADGAAPSEDLPTSALSLAAMEEIAARAPLAELMVQQTGMFLDPDRKLPLSSRLKPSFRQLGVSLTPLHLRPVVTEALADPYLLHHFTARLDLRLIQVLHDDLHAKGRLTRPSVHGGLPIHLGLSLEAILTPGFARMSRLARDAGARFWIEISLMQASVEIDLLEHVRSLLNLAHFEMILGPLDAAALSLTQPAKLRPGALKITWSPHLAEAAADPQGRFAETFSQIGAGRVVLQGVENEQALAWGQARGITHYQGTLLDHAQAAARMAGCRAASACTLRQCTSRATSLGLPGRTGCANPALLDAPPMPVS